MWRMHDLIDRLTTKSKISMTSSKEAADLARLREEWETARHCMDICSKADTHLNEDISIADKYATGDESVQYLVSTGEKTMRQVGGHLSDASIQQISQDTSNGHCD